MFKIYNYRIVFLKILQKRYSEIKNKRCNVKNTKIWKTREKNQIVSFTKLTEVIHSCQLLRLIITEK